MPNYLRTHRRTWGLTQKELAGLTGCRCGAQISRIERETRIPTLQIILSCQVLFGIPPQVLFPRVYGALEDRVMRRAYSLYQRLAKDDSPEGLRKREFLETVLSRAIQR